MIWTVATAALSVATLVIVVIFGLAMLRARSVRGDEHAHHD